MRGLASRLNRLVRIEAPQADAAFNGAGSGTWVLIDEVYAEILDLLPGRETRGDRVVNGIDFSVRPARVRIRFRDDLTSAMRLVLGNRVMQITTVPAEIGRREALEFLVEDYRPAGNPA